jgi:RNA polymerase sigma factor (sigma-70 family)
VLLRTQPDERLASMASEGNAAPFDELVRRHRASLIAYAGSLSPASRAEDVVQDSLLKAYVALQDGAEPELLRAWLFRIVRNTAIDQQRVTRHHDQLDENYDGVEQPPHALARREDLAALMASIRDLPPAQRQAIVQRELEGRGHEEIGRAMKLSAGSVRQLIYRARHTLREAAGSVIPLAVLRAATMPGAGEAVGGAGMAVALKVGLAAVVATGTIVAGASIDRGTDGGPAEALQLSTPHHDRVLADGGDAAGVAQGGDDRHQDEGSRSENSGKGSSGRDSGENSSPNSGPGGGSGHGGSSDDGSSSNSGPGSDGSGGGTGSDSGSSDGSGSGVSGGGELSGDGSGSGSGSGSDDVQTLGETTTTGSTEGPH